MVNLTQTDKISKARKVSFAGTEFDEVPVFGDGNCALNAFALGVIDMIKQDQLQLDAARQKEFMDALQQSLGFLRYRLSVYSSPFNQTYKDIVDAFTRTIEAIEASKGNFTQFVNFVKNNSSNRLQIAALQALAPALRKIGVDIYKKAIQQHITNQEMKSQLSENDKLFFANELSDAEGLLSNDKCAGTEILIPLAQVFFRVNLHMYEDGTKLPVDTKHHDIFNQQHLVPANAPDIHMVHKRAPEHWDFLLPANRNAGMAVDQSLALTDNSPKVVNAGQAANIKSTLDKTTEYVVLEQAQDELFKKTRARIPAKLELEEVSALMSKVNANLVTLQSESNAKSQHYNLVNQHEEFSSSIVNSVRTHLQISEQKVDAVKMPDEVRAIQKDLLLGRSAKNAAPAAWKTSQNQQQISADEKIARSLQNEEILQFLVRNYNVLSGATKSSSQKTQPADTVNQTTRQEIKI